MYACAKSNNYNLPVEKATHVHQLYNLKTTGKNDKTEE